ncbi:MAG TPA: RdgB/HAM1 family non-canonical purine NTP pyrophosphatase [Saprospiraceae bacterium]|nr:RdgB/HAM1 family non-canonical purine NTP pyrophosphatase [Saprospiraceae bacterium]
MLFLLASHNSNKKKEMELILPKEFEIKDLNDLGFETEIEETGKSFSENALIKARYFKEMTGLNCIAEDSGLEVVALNNEPGVYSARYAGLQKSDDDNIKLLLFKMKGLANREAQFHTVIACVFDDREYLFEGILKGLISEKPVGNYGFGYDPVFIPDGYQQTFAELGIDVKTKISHRSKAVKKMIQFFEDYK